MSGIGLSPSDRAAVRYARDLLDEIEATAKDVHFPWGRYLGRLEATTTALLRILEPEGDERG